MTAAGLTIRPVQPQDEPAVLRLLAASLQGGPTGERTAAFFRWKHRDNPFGASPGLLACGDDGEVLGVRLMLRWRFLLGERTVTAVRMVDTATAPHAQGRGIFKRLTLAALADSDADLVFNTPNAQSHPGYLRMGWRDVGVLPVHLRVARPVALARAAVRGVGQQAVAGRPAPVASALPTAAEVLGAQEVADLLSEHQGGRDAARLTTDRRPDFLQWRFGSAPDLDYRAVPVHRSGRLVGLGLGRLRRRGPLTELTLGEVLTRPGDQAGARAVLRAAARCGTDVVTAHLSAGTAAASVARRTGYVSPPRRGLLLVTNPRTELPVDPTSASSWQLSLGDLELF